MDTEQLAVVTTITSDDAAAALGVASLEPAPPEPGATSPPAHAANGTPLAAGRPPLQLILILSSIFILLSAVTRLGEAEGLYDGEAVYAIVASCLTLVTLGIRKAIIECTPPRQVRYLAVPAEVSREVSSQA
jgi:hypothetical protein